MSKVLADVSVNGRGYYGLGAPAVPFSDELFTYLRITDITDDGTINMNGLMSVNDERASEYRLKPNDIVFARTGASTGRNYFYDEDDGDFVYAGFLIKFSLDPQKINPKFIKYYCQSEQYRQWINSFNTGSTRGNINAKTLAQMPIPELPMKKQDALVEILDSLDKKIRCNKLVNQNLEQQMDAFFDDFFIKKADSTWKLGTITDLGNVVGGGTPSKKRDDYYTDQGIAWVTPKDMSLDRSKFFYHGGTDITPLGLSQSSAALMPVGTVLFSSRAPIGYIAIAANEICTNQGFKSVVPHKNIGTAYVYCFLKANLQMIENMASGSTFKEVSGSTMKAIPAVVPDNKSLETFNEFADPLFQQQQILESENRRLADIRDSLLPQLMSGKLDVSGLDI